MMDMSSELMDRVIANGAGTPAGGIPGNAAINTAVLPVSSGLTPDPEVREIKRRFIRKAEEKLRIVREFDACVSVGDKGAILRREGIYSSYIHRWRKERDQKALLGLSGQKRGPKEALAKEEKLRIAELEKQVLRLEKDLKKCHIIIDVQKKVSEILGIAQEPPVDGAQS